MFCAPGIIFSVTEGVGSSFPVLLSRTRFRRYRGRRVPFSCFSRSDKFSAIPTTSCPVFIFCAPGVVLGGTEGVSPIFMFCPPGLFFGGAEGVGVLFSCFTLPDSFSAVPRSSGAVFMFCAPVLVFGGTEGVGSRFHVMRCRTRFGRYLGRRVLFSYFVLPDSFSAVPRASGPVFMFFASGLVYGRNECVGARFDVLRSRTRFRRFRGRQVPFSCFARPSSFSAESRASGPVFIFCVPGRVLGGT
jgi:hypothetical protein